jgi:DNA-cytosine methyltransferase
MKVLSLFDGMSCGQIALNRLGIEVDAYYASEIDKYAMEITQKNFPETIQVGDVCAVRGEDYQDVDLILAGSPCQGFSFAGKQLAFDDPRSALFFEFIRLLKEIKPKYFLLENVKMKKEYLQIISEQVSACYPEIPFGIEPIFINSSLVSAQSRQRYYWTNIPNITQPEERGIVLRDILEEDPGENPVKDTARNQRHYKNLDEKSLCMTATMYKGAGNNGMTLVPIRAGAWRGRSLDESGKNVKWKETKPKQMLETRKDEKSNAVSTFTKDNVVVHSYREVRTEEAKQARKENRQKTGKDHTPFRSKELQPREDGKVGTVTPGLNNDHRISLTRDDTQEVYWRKLTPLECERLQTVPDNYTEGVSNTQRYKMLGNGWTVEVICHILKNMEV